MASLTDEKLLTALAHKEPEVAEEEARLPVTTAEVYEQHGAMVIRWASRLGGPSTELDDIVQEVFLRVQKDLPGFRGEAQITTWLYQITRNVVGHRRRKNSVRKWLAGSAVEVAGHLPTNSLSPVEALERRQSVERLYRALDGMSEKYRTVFILFEMERLSGEEIAGIMEAKVETVWVWLHRARAQFFKQAARLESEESTS